MPVCHWHCRLGLSAGALNLLLGRTISSYIERNPVRAGLMERAQDWLWSSAAPQREGLPVLAVSPVPHAADWLRYVNEPQTEAEVESLRNVLIAADRMATMRGDRGPGGQFASARSAAEERCAAGNVVQLG